MRVLPILCALGLASTSAAQPAVPSKAIAAQLTKAIQQYLGGSGDDAPEPLPRFAFASSSFAVSPRNLDDARDNPPDVAIPSAKKTTVAVAADGKAAWIATDVGRYGTCGDSTRCYTKPATDWFHVTALFDLPSGRPIAWHIGEPLTAKDQRLAMSKGPMLDALPRKIDPGAEPVVAVFEASLASSTAFAATVAARKDVVLYGSALAERYVSGATVKKQLSRWGLAFKIQNGLQAGVTASGTVAWVAAHVDARPVNKPTASPTPYRVLAIYEKSSTGWTLVNAHFSFTWN